MYAVQWGVKVCREFLHNTFISEVYTVRNIFEMLDYNLNNMMQFKGAYYYNLAAKQNDLIYDLSEDEFEITTTGEAFKLLKNIHNWKYSAATHTSNLDNFKVYYVSRPNSTCWKYFILNYSGTGQEIDYIEIDDNGFEGNINVTKTTIDSEAGVLTILESQPDPEYMIGITSSNIALDPYDQYNVVIPAYSITIIEPYSCGPIRSAEPQGSTEADEVALNVHPNPASSTLFIDAPFNGETEVVILDLLGNVLQTTNEYLMNSQSVGIDISGLASGAYLVCCQNNNNFYQCKFVVAK